jgi:hypothetical protein
MSYFELKIANIPIGSAPRSEGDDLCAQVNVGEISQSLLHAHTRDYGKEIAAYQLTLEDSGRDGDGIRATIFHYCADKLVVDFLIPDDSLDTLIESLRAIQNLRKAE